MADTTQGFGDLINHVNDLSSSMETSATSEESQDGSPDVESQDLIGEDNVLKSGKSGEDRKDDTNKEHGEHGKKAKGNKKNEKDDEDDEDKKDKDDKDVKKAENLTVVEDGRQEKKPEAEPEPEPEKDPKPVQKGITTEDVYAAFGSVVNSFESVAKSNAETKETANSLIKSNESLEMRFEELYRAVTEMQGMLTNNAPVEKEDKPVENSEETPDKDPKEAPKKEEPKEAPEADPKEEPATPGLEKATQYQEDPSQAPIINKQGESSLGDLQKTETTPAPEPKPEPTPLEHVTKNFQKYWETYAKSRNGGMTVNKSETVKGQLLRIHHGNASDQDAKEIMRTLR